jgi:hypothetical protein
MTIAGVSTFRRNRLTTLARLRRVSRAIARLDEYEAAQLMPVDIRPQVRPPDLSRDALKSLRQTLEEVLAELEVMWERRN